EDVVQDACLRALKYFDGYRGEQGTSARAWLLAIVRNTAFSSRHRRRPDNDALEFDEAQHSDAVADAHPEAALLRSAAKESVGRALDRPAPEFRDVIVLRGLEGLSYKEICDVACVPIGVEVARVYLPRRRLHQGVRV